MHDPLRPNFALLANYVPKCKMSSGPYGPIFNLKVNRATECFDKRILTELVSIVQVLKRVSQCVWVDMRLYWCLKLNDTVSLFQSKIRRFNSSPTETTGNHQPKYGYTVGLVEGPKITVLRTSRSTQLGLSAYGCNISTSGVYSMPQVVLILILYM